MSISSLAAGPAGAAPGLSFGLPPSRPLATRVFLFSMYFGVLLSCHPNCMITAVMFSSDPFWNAVRTTFLAASSASSQCLPAQSTISWLLSTLVIPSVHKIRKRSLSVIGMTFTSGSAVERADGDLKLESPRDLVIDRPAYSLRAAFDAPALAGAAMRQAPRTLSTRPPTRSMRFFSSNREGVWSSVTATPWPARQRMARESPTWARTSRSGVPSFGLPWSRATRPVEPTVSNFFRSARLRISLSVWRNASRTATLSFSSRDAGCTCFWRNCARIDLCICFEAISETCAPPCPSKTPKYTPSSSIASSKVCRSRSSVCLPGQLSQCTRTLRDSAVTW
mmetsp:Transcript_35317/g.77160  ORF Transcript_35317/g.77160 Transcript_35317/m.77160 type:complete len:337 (-) Transcript_35317:204-1214(-)